MGMLEAMADDETTGLVAGELAAGDSSSLSLESLYARHAAPLARALHAAGVPDAHDAVQEAFVQAVVHWRKVSRYDDPLSWIRRVAINRGHNRRRARRRQQAPANRSRPSAVTPTRISPGSSRRCHRSNGSRSRSTTSPIFRSPRWRTQ